jgi:type VI secretion system protein VasG
MIDAILTNTVLPQISQGVLKGMVEGKPVSKVDVSVHNSEFGYEFA